MWNPFRRSRKPSEPPELPARQYVLAKADGVVEAVMASYIVISGERYDCSAPLVELGRTVVKGQPVGK